MTTAWPRWLGAAGRWALACALLVPAQVSLSQSAPAAPEPHAAPDTAQPLPDAARLLTLPRLTERQIKEFLGDLAAQLEMTSGYRPVAADFKLPLPPLSDRLTPAGVVLRVDGERTQLIRFGYALQPRRLPQLYIYGITITPGGVVPNADAAANVLDPVLRTMLIERSKVLEKLRLSDLESKIITLSYMDADGALFALRAMGYSAITDENAMAKDDSYRGDDVPLLAGGTSAAADVAATGGTPPAGGEGGPKFPVLRNLPSSISYDRLPLIVKMPTPDPRNVGLVGALPDAQAAAAAQQSSLGLTAVPSAANSLGPTMSAGTSQLLVLYHPGSPEQFLKVKQVIGDVIDKPARQVFVEGMVLEISQEGLEQLGVQWQRNSGTTSITLGTLTSLAGATGASALDVTRDSRTVFDPKQIINRINALVENNKAEVLSRPSVLTLDNRQATIRVGTDIPIATSKDASAGLASGRVSFSFQYLPTGILLNVRPRISEDNREISMVIDATVSATVANADLTVRDPGTNQVLASAPMISTRRVQTYARIVNNQPLIIGGLLSRDQIKAGDKVPLLGDIPIIGHLFGFHSTQDSRREVIIVLTPSVVTEEFRATKWQLPKDDDRFDNFGTTLFRESYRIRAEDLIDSQHIRFNRRLLDYRATVAKVVEKEPRLAEIAPFSRFVGSRVPGEFTFVSGMLSRMLGRLNVAEPVNLDKLIFFQGLRGAEFKTDSVGALLKRLGDGNSYKSFFTKNPGKALAISFRLRRSSNSPEDLNAEPLAETSLVDCPDRDTWRHLLWTLNQPYADGTARYTMLIQDPSDLERVKLAIAVKNTVLANGNESAIVFDFFLPGRMVAMQEIPKDWERTLEGTVARYFFWGEMFYPAFTEELNRAIADLDQALHKPEMAPFVAGIKLP